MLQRGVVHLKYDGTRAETRFRLSPKRTSPFKSAGASVQSTAGSRGVRISGSNAGYTKFRGSVRVLATHSIHQFLLHFPSHASPCAITFQTHSINGLFFILLNICHIIKCHENLIHLRSVHEIHMKCSSYNYRTGELCSN